MLHKNRRAEIHDESSKQLAGSQILNMSRRGPAVLLVGHPLPAVREHLSVPSDETIECDRCASRAEDRGRFDAGSRKAQRAQFRFDAHLLAGRRIRDEILFAFAFAKAHVRKQRALLAEALRRVHGVAAVQDKGRKSGRRARACTEGEQKYKRESTTNTWRG